MTCRICLEDGDTISVCNCKGTQGHVHLECIQKWIDVSKKNTCELCHVSFSPDVYQNIRPIANIADPKATMIVMISLGCFFSIVSGYNISNETTHFPDDLVGTVFTIALCFGLHLFSWIILNHYNHKVSILGAFLWCLLFLWVSIVLQSEGAGFDFEAVRISYMFNVIYTCVAVCINVSCIHYSDV